MMIHRHWLVPTLALAVAAPLLAQETATEVTLRNEAALDLYGPDGGTDPWELILTGSGSNDNDFDSGGFQINAEIGYYFTPELYVALRQGFGYSDFGDSTWTGSTSGAFDYHFDLDRLRPFVGVSFGGLYGEDVEETFIAGPEAGVKYYVNTDTFLYGRVAYEFLFDDADEADDAFDDGRFVYVVGIGFNF